MNAIYHWVGFAVVWGAVALGCYAAWAHRPRNSFTRRMGNARLWLKTFLLHRPLRVATDWPAGMFAWYQPRRRSALLSWERDIIAATIRYARRHGFNDKPAAGPTT